MFNYYSTLNNPWRKLEFFHWNISLVVSIQIYKDNSTYFPNQALLDFLHWKITGHLLSWHNVMWCNQANLSYIIYSWACPGQYSYDMDIIYTFETGGPLLQSGVMIQLGLHPSLLLSYQYWDLYYGLYLNFWQHATADCTNKLRIFLDCGLWTLQLR